MKKFAYVTNKGEVAHIIEPATEDALQDGQVVGEYLVVEVPYQEDTTELLTTRVYDAVSKQWSNRAPRPSVAHYWDGGWKLDQTKLQQEIRTKRSFLLAKTDWTQVADAPISEQRKQDWRVYRQALRDLPQTYANIISIDEVQWPTPPSE
jgi:hypothetical protein